MMNPHGSSGHDSTSPDINTKSQSTRPRTVTKRRWLVSGVIALLMAGVLSACGDLAEVESDDKSASSSQTGGSGDTDESAKPQAEKEPSMTASQKNAVRAAENYISLMPFSRLGLINQLSSEHGDGYSVEDATFAVDHIKVNWNEQAAKAAKNYLDLMPFSRSGLIDQLSSEHGDKFTREQAEYGVKQAGL